MSSGRSSCTGSEGGGCSVSAAAAAAVHGGALGSPSAVGGAAGKRGDASAPTAQLTASAAAGLASAAASVCAAGSAGSAPPAPTGTLDSPLVSRSYILCCSFISSCVCSLRSSSTFLSKSRLSINIRWFSSARTRSSSSISFSSSSQKESSLPPTLSAGGQGVACSGAATGVASVFSSAAVSLGQTCPSSTSTLGDLSATSDRQGRLPSFISPRADRIVVRDSVISSTLLSLDFKSSSCILARLCSSLSSFSSAASACCRFSFAISIFSNASSRRRSSSSFRSASSSSSANRLRSSSSFCRCSSRSCSCFCISSLMRILRSSSF
mmetsp:Transcript_43286/g.109339  ORF Transcript_43286/g.109339 Transcript_43286/m.109339 type:complete len:324 (-) Transcript_43286:993-1964(-)